jgi:tetratricopeptide (TPR) repeat protein
LSEHLTSEKLEALLAGRLRRHEARSIVAHLVRSCEVCVPVLQPQPADEEEYDRAISAAMEAARTLDRERADAIAWLSGYLSRKSYFFFKLPLWKRRELATWGFCDVLLRASVALRHDYPAQMVHLAEVAVAASRMVRFPKVAPERKPRPGVLPRFKDLEARACAELANAYRVADNFPRAELAMNRAFGCFHVGTRDPLLFARLNDVAASLYAAQRRFDEAFACVAEAYSTYSALGDHHAAGRVLVGAGVFSRWAGKPEIAVQRLLQGVQAIDRNRDPELVFWALHNLLLVMVDLGELDEARAHLTSLQPLYEARGRRVIDARLRWTVGRLALNLEVFDVAEKELTAARQFFAEQGMPYHSAVTGLELAALWFRQGETAKVKGIVGNLVRVLGRALQREALAAILVLKKALQREHASVELIESTASALERFAASAGRGKKV